MITPLIIALIALAILVIARKPRAANDRHGSVLNPKDNDQKAPNHGQGKSLTVASYNVQTGKNMQGQRDITRAADVLSMVDLAGIQEVYAANWLNKFGLGICQTETLAKRGGFDWIFCPTRFRWFRENRGNAILSKIPITSWRTTMLPDKSGNSFRNMTVVKFEWQGQDCHFINTHLHTSLGKSEQLEVVLDEFRKYSNAILVGDFNSRPDTQLLVECLQSSQVTDAILHSNIDNQNDQRIDWILTKGWAIRSGNSIDKGISDHPYYEVSLELLES